MLKTTIQDLNQTQQKSSIWAIFFAAVVRLRLHFDRRLSVSVDLPFFFCPNPFVTSYLFTFSLDSIIFVLKTWTFFLFFSNSKAIFDRFYISLLDLFSWRLFHWVEIITVLTLWVIAYLIWPYVYIHNGTWHTERSPNCPLPLHSSCMPSRVCVERSGQQRTLANSSDWADIWFQKKHKLFLPFRF